MALQESKRITELDLANPLTDADLFAVVQNGRTKRATSSQVRQLTSDGCQCTLVSRFTTVGTDANTTKKFLETYTLPSDAIVNDGSYLEIHAAGTFAANANGKLVQLNLKQNSTGLSVNFSIPLGNYNDDLWYIDLRLQKSGALNYVVSGEGVVMDNDQTALQTAQSIPYLVGDGNGCDWTAGDLQICVTGTNSSASANDITVNTFIIDAHLVDANS